MCSWVRKPWRLCAAFLSGAGGAAFGVGFVLGPALGGVLYLLKPWLSPVTALRPLTIS